MLYYLTLGFCVWALMIVTALFVMKVVPRFCPDPERIREQIRESMEDLSNVDFSGFMTMGTVSCVIIIAWPIVLMMIALILVAAILGGIPFMIVHYLSADNRGSNR